MSSVSSTAGQKRKRTVVTLEKKLEIIAELKKGLSQRAVAEKFTIAKSTVSDIWKDRLKIEDRVAASDDVTFAKRRCIIREAKFDLVDEAVWKWFTQQRSKGGAISGVLLMEKAQMYFSKLYPDADPDDFKASTGWLQKFNQRHGISSSTLRGEILSADTSAVEPFCKELQEVIEREGYSRDVIFNADETGLWWRMMPSKSLTASTEKRPANFKKAKDRVTILACANAAGTCRIPLLLINKSKKPRCFKHMDMENLPVHYAAQSKSWMDSKLFSEWFNDRFLPAVRKFCREKSLPEKALLLLDNAPSHPSSASLQSADGKIKTMFLPPNTTAIIQPMDQGVLESCKRRYKKKMTRHVLEQNEVDDCTIPECLKKITLKDVVYWVAEAWAEGSESSLGKAWKKLLPPTDEAVDAPPADEVTASSSTEGDAGAEMDELQVLSRQLAHKNAPEDFTEWLTTEDTDPGHQILDDDEILDETVAAHNNVSVGDVSDDGSDEELAVDDTVTPAQAFDALDVSLRWLESQRVEGTHLLLVKQWRDAAARLRRESLKQSSITSFFHRQ